MNRPNLPGLNQLDIMSSRRTTMLQVPSVISETDASNAATEHKAQIVTITVKPPVPGKSSQATYFLNAWKLRDGTNMPLISIKNVVIFRGAINAGDLTNPLVMLSGGKLRDQQISIRKGDMSPEFWNFVDYVDQAWLSQTKIIKKERKEKLVIHPIITRVYGPKSDKRGQDLPEPVLNIKLKTSAHYASNYHFIKLQNKVQSDIRDFTKVIKSRQTGVNDYAPATVMDKYGQVQVVNDDNLHLFITAGSTIVSGRLNFNTGTITGTGYSAKPLAQQLVIRPMSTTVEWEDDLVPDNSSGEDEKSASGAEDAEELDDEVEEEVF